ncbi:MAG: hypothetical protein IT462_05275 [Planctomycetes bacterium]|nr:hypothetical protein [Planctomycetota bacterium]
MSKPSKSSLPRRTHAAEKPVHGTREAEQKRLAAKAADAERDPVDEALHGRNVKELWTTYKATGDTEARNALAEFYFDLVRANAENISEVLARAIEENDLYQAGVVGFFEAMKDYDPKAGMTFEDFGSLAVRRSIMHEIRGLIDSDESE